MIEWFMSGGVSMWPILGAALVSAGLAVDAGRKLLGAPASATEMARVRTRIDAVLFWGGFAALVGLIGTLVGFAKMAAWLADASGVPESLVWSGIRVSLVTSTFGLLVLVVSLGAWFGLRVVHRRRTGAS